MRCCDSYHIGTSHPVLALDLSAKRREQGVDVRSLIPYFFVSTQPLGWKCSECEKVFRIKVALGAPPPYPMPEIRAEFRTHKCEERKAKAAVKQ